MVLIHGRVLDASPVFDTYWRFAAERQAVYIARVQGLAPPWSSDETIRAFRFTNPFRASDRVSQFLISDVIYGDDTAALSADDVVFRVLLFKFFNKISTWTALEAQVGLISWHSYSRANYLAALSELASTGPIYSAAYVIPPPRLGAARKHENHLLLLERMMGDRLADRVVNAERLQDLYTSLLAYPSIGRFLAFQFAIDLNYSALTTFDEDEFVVAGPGAVDGIRKCFGTDSAGREDAIIRYMVESQEEHFERLGLSFDGLFGRRLHLIDCQNLFCEVDKYSRVVHPTVSGVSGRSRIKQRFRETRLPISTTFPPKWSVATPTSAHDAERSSGQVDFYDGLFAVS